MVFNEISNQWILVGLPSHGYNCSNGHVSSVYTRVSAYRAWKDQNIRGRNHFNANRCKGQMKGDKMNGEGTCHFPDGNKYVDDWFEGKRTGGGVFTWMSGQTYTGQFKGGRFHGNGTYFFNNGNKYVGHWVTDKRAGHGVYTWPNGKIYTGQFNDSKILGKGVITWPSGDRYEGQCKHGRGTFHSNGRKFEGHWIDDQFDSEC